MNHCQKCGGEVKADDEFCPLCGAKIIKEKNSKPQLPKIKITEVIKKLFTGRINRKNWLLGFLAVTIIPFALIFSVDIIWGYILLSIHATGLGVSSWIIIAVLAIIAIASALITISLSVRRFHDIGNSGWWIFLGATPYIGFLVLFYLLIRQGKPTANKYGDKPSQAANLWAIIFNL